MKKLFFLLLIASMSVAYTGEINLDRAEATGPDDLSSVFWSDPIDSFSQSMYVQQGCFARLYTDKTHEFKTLNLLGSATVADFEHAMGKDIEGDVNYIYVGPNAILKFYNSSGLRRLMEVVGPDEKYFDEAKLNRVDSVELECL